MMHRRRASGPLAAAAVAAALCAAPVPPSDAGSLAPADVAIDAAGRTGPFWGSDAGTLLYARGSGDTQFLVRRALGTASEVLFESGTTARGTEIWSAFHAGALNDRGDAAFVASTSLDDDPGTAEDERLLPPRRGVWALRGGVPLSLGRWGGASPVPDGAGGFVPWGTFFDAAPAGRPGASLLTVHFSAQLGGADGRQGVFRWDEATGQTTPVALVGDTAPAGGAFSAFTRLRVNESGDVVFHALTRLTPESAPTSGLFLVDRGGARSRLVKFGTGGDAAPGGGTLSLVQDFDADGAGGVVLAAALSGPRATTGLFRRTAGGALERLAREGDAGPAGGTYGSFFESQVRCAEDGTAVFVVPLVRGSSPTGVFSVAPGTTAALPLAGPAEPLVIASLGAGRAAYQTEAETRTVVPADGSEEGPTDFRVALVDVRNSVAAGRDSLRLDARFRLPPWGTGPGRAPPAVLSGLSERRTAAALLGATDVARIREVRVQVSQSPGQVLVFGIGGTDAAPVGTVTMNGAAAAARLVLSRTRDGATWTFRAPAGQGRFSIDVARGAASLSITRADLFPSFDADGFGVQMTLRTDADVAAARTGDDAHFHRAVSLRADQPSFGTGRRVLSRGERLPGGTLFVDALKVTRALRTVRGQAAPVVSSDRVAMSGTLRLAPGATAPATAGLSADVTLGGASFPAIPLRRVGRAGSKYTGKATIGGARVTFAADCVRGTFSFSASGVPPLAALADADFSGSLGPNDARRAVGGMALPVEIRIERAYVAAFDVAMTRLPGGKTFTR